MKNYESIIIFKPSTEEERRQELMNKFTGIIEANGEVLKVDEWGQKRLAYEIEKIREGYYVLVNFKADTSLPKELERNFRISDEVLRYIVVNLEDK